MKNKLKFLILLCITSLIVSCSEDDSSPTLIKEFTVTDADGNVYNTITIGNQVWMLENLKTTKYNDGTAITEWIFGMDWASLNNQLAQYQWANTNDLNNVNDTELPFDYYGAMYNHFAIESGKLAPEGWRIPSMQDFIELENYLVANGFETKIALALKSESGWSASSVNGTNTTKFNGLPNGYVTSVGTATASEIICSWATSDVAEGNLNSSLTRKWVQLYNEPTILYSDTSITLGVGIRCIKN
jgi:uncharacterized protein (TIGR02145 family)